MVRIFLDKYYVHTDTAELKFLGVNSLSVYSLLTELYDISTSETIVYILR